MIKPTRKLKFLRMENAQTMVEFALVFPIILLITYGIMEFGRMIWIYAAVTGAAREGARYGAAAGDISGNRTRHYMNCSGIYDAVARDAILIPIQPSNITIWYDSGPGTTHVKDTCPPKDTYGMDMIKLGYRIGVRVRVHYLPIINFLDLQGFDIVGENARTILSNLEIK